MDEQSPMDLRQEKIIELASTSDAVAMRLRAWASASDFVCKFESPRKWVFTRGSNWHALYTSDIRKLPTEVVVELVTDQPLLVHSVMHIRTALQYTSPSDEKRMSEQLDLLIAHLRGAL